MDGEQLSACKEAPPLSHYTASDASSGELLLHRCDGQRLVLRASGERVVHQEDDGTRLTSWQGANWQNADAEGSAFLWECSSGFLPVAYSERRKINGSPAQAFVARLSRSVCIVSDAESASHLIALDNATIAIDADGNVVFACSPDHSEQQAETSLQLIERHWPALQEVRGGHYRPADSIEFCLSEGSARVRQGGEQLVRIEKSGDVHLSSTLRSDEGEKSALFVVEPLGGTVMEWHEREAFAQLFPETPGQLVTDEQLGLHSHLTCVIQQQHCQSQPYEAPTLLASRRDEPTHEQASPQLDATTIRRFIDFTLPASAFESSDIKRPLLDACSRFERLLQRPQTLSINHYLSHWNAQRRSTTPINNNDSIAERVVSTPKHDEKRTRTKRQPANFAPKTSIVVPYFQSPSGLAWLAASGDATTIEYSLLEESAGDTSLSSEMERIDLGVLDWRAHKAIASVRLRCGERALQVRVNELEPRNAVGWLSARVNAGGAIELSLAWDESIVAKRSQVLSGVLQLQMEDGSMRFAPVTAALTA